MANSTARLFNTGREPGRPRQTGQVFAFGASPNCVEQPQNIFVFVRSWACTSSPITASYLAITSGDTAVSAALLTLMVGQLYHQHTAPFGTHMHIRPLASAGPLAAAALGAFFRQARIRRTGFQRTAHHRLTCSRRKVRLQRSSSP